MTLGELTANHIGKSIRTSPSEPARVISSVRHFRMTNPADPKETLRMTCVLINSAVKEGELNMHQDRSDTTVVLANG